MTWSYPKIPQNVYQKTRNHKFSKVAGYKIKIQKSVCFLYINNTHAEKEVRETILFAIASNTIKYFGINLTKENNDLFNENYKPLKREIKEAIRTWKDLPCPWIMEHCKNGHSTKSNLHVQCNSYQKSNDILQRNKKNHAMHM
jgi:hypothetical protein